MNYEYIWNQTIKKSKKVQKAIQWFEKKGIADYRVFPYAAETNEVTWTSKYELGCTCCFGKEFDEKPTIQFYVGDNLGNWDLELFEYDHDKFEQYKNNEIEFTNYAMSLEELITENEYINYIVDFIDNKAYGIRTNLPTELAKEASKELEIEHVFGTLSVIDVIRYKKGIVDKSEIEKLSKKLDYDDLKIKKDKKEYSK